jgi:hypothetical protein
LDRWVAVVVAEAVSRIAKYHASPGPSQASLKRLSKGRLHYCKPWRMRGDGDGSQNLTM